MQKRWWRGRKEKRDIDEEGCDKRTKTKVKKKQKKRGKEKKEELIRDREDEK